MRTADNRTHFELGLLGPYTPISVEVLFKKKFRGGDELDRRVEYGRLAETRPRFREILKNEPLAKDDETTRAEEKIRNERRKGGNNVG